MRVVSLDRFGGPEVLRVIDAPRPVPGRTEVLVRVHAAGINPVDLKQRNGSGPLTTLPMILGWDVAGVVAATGDGVTILSQGDEVYGMPWFPRQAGGYGEYVTAPSRQFAPKPAALSFAEAASLPLSGLTAWQMLVDTAHLRAGLRVLIHGAAGGVGSLAVQIAKALGGHVIGTARTAHHDSLRALGADELIDYTAVRFEDAVDKVDVVLDFVGKDYTARSVTVVPAGGVVIRAPGGLEESTVEHGAANGVRVTSFQVEPDHASLLAVTDLVEQGRLRPNLGAVVPLDEVQQAHRMAESHAVDGKVVLSV